MTRLTRSQQKVSLSEKIIQHVAALEERIAQLEAMMGGSSSLVAGGQFATKELTVPNPNNTSLKDVVYTLRPVRDSRKAENGITSELEIRNSDLIHVMNEEIGTYPGVDFEGNVVLMENPFPAVVSLPALPTSS